MISSPDEVEKIKDILLDSDVFIHFCKLEKTDLLNKVFEGRIKITKEVKEELSCRIEYQNQIDNFIQKYGIEVVDISTDRDYMFEYCKLILSFGKGESSCMATAKIMNLSIASSNIKDVKEFCKANMIKNYPFLEILLLAIDKSLLTEEKANKMIEEAITSGAKLPANSIRNYRIFKQSNP